MEMHSSNLHIYLDIDKWALFCAKFVMKSNLILQHYNMKEGLAELILSIHRQITGLDLIVIFQHPSPSNNPVLHDVLIEGTLECMSMCAMNIVTSLHFIYNWHLNRKCWKKNELKELIIQECSSSLLSSLSIISDRCISIDDTLLVDQPLHRIVPHKGWALIIRITWNALANCLKDTMNNDPLEMESYPIEVVKHMKEDKEVLVFCYAMHQ